MPDTLTHYFLNVTYIMLRLVSISTITGTGATVIQITINRGILNGPNLRIRTLTLSWNKPFGTHIDPLGPATGSALVAVIRTVPASLTA